MDTCAPLPGELSSLCLMNPTGPFLFCYLFNDIETLLLTLSSTPLNGGNSEMGLGQELLLLPLSYNVTEELLSTRSFLYALGVLRTLHLCSFLIGYKRSVNKTTICHSFTSNVLIYSFCPSAIINSVLV